MFFDKNNNFACGQCAVGKLNAEVTVSEPDCKWREKDGIIYFSVTSNGKTGQQWIDHFTDKKIRVSDQVKSRLLSDDFKNSIAENTTTTEVAVMKGLLWNDKDRVTKNIRAEADMRQWSSPNREVACLIRDKFSDQELKDMGLYWLVIMHDPIYDGGPHLLYAYSSDDEPGLSSYYGESGVSWLSDSGFAFSVSFLISEALADK